MGLQTRLQSTPPLLSMACLDVETPSICRGKFKSVLQLCVQQRRTREQLVEQGIMPPLKTPATFHEQIRSLERARTGNFLKHKLCSRPERSELVHMRILQETQAEPSLQATQMKQKRARLADNLNEKIAQRPSPMELVEKKILPVDPTVEEVVDGNKANSSKPADIYSFNEDSSDALSPQQPTNHQSPCSTSASPRESGGSDATSASSIQPSSSPNSQSPSDSVNLVSTTEQLNNQKAPTPQTATTVARCITPGSGLMKQSLPKLPGDKSRSKRSKEPKPRVKKLKYHQYIPPDQKQELSEVQMDSAYARLLQQQQQFLHLQILSQQQSNYQPGPPPIVKPAAEVQTSCSSVVPALVQLQHNQTNRKPDHLPANLDEMKVAELKMELKLRSLPVSGTKLDLIERLKSYQENANLQTAAAIDKTVVSAASQSENTKLSPPVSPIASKVSSMGIEDCSMADSPTVLEDNMSPSHTAPCVDSAQECPMEHRSNEKDSEKDKRLHEKERQIEELIRKLEQEQRLVEELKMQLEVEKRSQQGDSPPHLVPIKVKAESRTPSNCSETCNSPGLPVLIKQEEAQNQSHLTLPSHFIVSQQTIKQPVETGAHVLLPAALPATAVTIQLPASSITLHTNDSSAATGLIPGLLLASGQLPQKSESSAASQQRCSNQPPTKAWKVDSSAQSLLSTFRVSGCPVGDSSCQAESKDPKNKSPHPSQSAFLEQPKFTNHVSKCKDPPRYEDAVKQTRSMLSAVHGPTAASQEMDDLFDVLIESGEISPFIGQDITHQDKPLPVTASVTTLPINTVLSRPPPVVQVAQLPAAPLNSATSLADLPSASRLGTILDGTLAACTEELRSAMAAVEVDFNESTLPPSLNLHITNMDMDNMDWLDLSLSVPAEGVNSLDLSAQVGVFSSDFLDSHELQLNWE